MNDSKLFYDNISFSSNNIIKEIIEIKNKNNSADVTDKINSLQGFISQLREYKEKDDSEYSLYRNRWTTYLLSSYINKSNNENENGSCQSGNLSFNQESELFYQTTVNESYFNEIDSVLNKIHTILEGIKLDDEKPYETYNRFVKSFDIPDEKYEEIFENCITYTIDKFKAHANPLNKLKIEFYHDINDPAEAYADRIEAYFSYIKCNKARKISIIKVQQLTAHEATHHYQFTFLDDIISSYPEFHLADYSMNLYSYLLEAGAEVAVDLIFPYKERREHLEKVLLPLICRSTSSNEIDILMKLDYLTTKVWAGYINTAMKYLNKEISFEESNRIMHEKYFKQENSWPNTLFFKNFGSYIGSYGWGKQLILKYLNIKEGNIKENYEIEKDFQTFIEFQKKIVIPF